MCGHKPNKKVPSSKRNGTGMSSFCLLNGIIGCVRGRIKSSFFCQLEYSQVQVCSRTQLPLKSMDMGTWSWNMPKLNLQLGWSKLCDLKSLNSKPIWRRSKDICDSPALCVTRYDAWEDESRRRAGGKASCALILPSEEAVSYSSCDSQHPGWRMTHLSHPSTSPFFALTVKQGWAMQTYLPHPLTSKGDP